MNEVPEPGLDLAWRPTPIEKLSSLTNGYESNIFVKRDDLTSGVAQGNKIRKLEYLLSDALQQNTDIIITCGGIHSNHCRAVTVLSRQLGLDSYLVLLGDEPDIYDGNLLISYLAGAEVRYISMKEFSGDFQRELKEAENNLIDRGLDPYVVPLGGSNEVGSLGYVNAYMEINRYEEENQVEFDRIVTAVGSSGTCAGLVTGAILKEKDVDIVGVDVTPYGANYQLQRITELVESMYREITGEQLNPEVIDEYLEVVSGYVGPGYGEPSDQDIDTIVKLTSEEGLLLDPSYTSKAFRYLMDTLNEYNSSLFLHTGGSYSLFPIRKSLTEKIRGSGDKFKQFR